MNILKQKISSATLSFFLVMLYAPYSLADDTEIFFSNSVSTAIKPNVMFVMDTSGSMSNKDGGSTSRLDRMKSALSSMIEQATNVNIGIMRFITVGGTVIHPIKDIDQVTSSSSIGDLTVRIAESADDAEENQTSHGVALSNQSLTMTTTVNGGTVLIDQRISQSSDDVEERAGRDLYVTSSDLELLRDSVTQTVGLRFPNLTIPVGATILSASLEFVIEGKEQDYNTPVDISIFAEADDTGTFDSSDRTNVSTRTKTAKSVDWYITANSPDVGDPINTPDLTDVVSEVVGAGTWASGNALTFILDRTGNTGERTVESYDGSPADAPRLRISYQAGGVGTTSENLIGLRFQDVEIPQGVTITSASIDFTAAAASSGTASFTLRGEDVDDSTSFTTASSNISSRSRTTAAVNWPGVSNWAAAGDLNSTPDLTSIVQEITNRSGWCGGNSLSILLHSSGANLSSRLAKSYDDNASDSPTLKVTYDTVNVPAGANQCISKKYVASISSSANDAEQNVSDGSMTLTSNDLEMVQDGNGSSNKQIIGIRFEDLQIPNASDITRAYLEFSSDGSHSGNTSLTIHGQDIDSADIFTSSDYDITAGRSLTSSSTSWSNIPAWTDGLTYTSPDISTVVKEIVDRSGWSAGNDMVFILSGSGKRKADTYDESPALGARLIVQAKSYGVPVASTKTIRDELLDIVDDMYHSSGTPIVDSLYEAALYYRGENVDKGRSRGTSSKRRYDRASHPDSYAGATHYYPPGCSTENQNDSACEGEIIDTSTGTPIYISPITNECQTNNIILLSDGQATTYDAVSKIKSMANITSCAHSGAEECGPELAKFLAEEDQVPTVALPDKQTVKTYTIGFNNNDPFLEAIARAGGGEYFTASSSSQLLNRFQQILRSILKVDTTFVSPGVTVNSFNRLNHRDELYFSLFRPDSAPTWPGNLKRYRLDKTGEIHDNNSPSQVATDPTTGFFSAGAKSWWSSQADGNVVADGGAAEKLPATNARKVYTYYSGGSANLSAATNALTYTNKANISKVRLGIETATDAYHESLIDWARGVDVLDDDSDGDFTDARNALGDPLHSIPHLVTYGGTNASPDITVYYGDNQGFVHGIDGATGVEEFAFIPEALLPNLKTFYENSESSDHPYGMDGAVTTWVKDVNGDGQIVAADGDHVYLYVGMRRGGRNYYALDVTNRAAPQMLWSITGGSGDFAELGQSWSKPVKTKVQINNSTKDVLIFSAGYDESQDDYTSRTVDTMGRAVYIVDATTGALLWSAGHDNSFSLELTDMDYSIPSEMRVIDVNGDGLADQMYVGDMGGQVWRFDINNGANTNALVTGAVIADLAGSSSADNRRFYHAPDVSVLSEGTSKNLMIVIGSGFQAHPLNQIIDDRLYVLKSPDVYEKPTSYTKLTEAGVGANGLYDATDNHLGHVSAVNTLAQQTAAFSALAASSGWYIRLSGTGEKVLATSTTVAGEIFVTTYEPTSTSTGCTVSAGTPWLYHMDVSNATPVKNYDGIGLDTELTAPDRRVQLQTPALPPSPQRLRIDGQDIICVGTECETITSAETLIKTYWIEED